MPWWLLWTVRGGSPTSTANWGQSMSDRPRKLHWPRSRAFKDLAVVFIVAVLAVVVASLFDVFERLVEWSRTYEWAEVDEVGVGLVVLAVAIGVFSLRRWREARREIAERRRAEERSAHLSSVLGAIRDVNQLIARERDRGRLIQGACDLLAQARGFGLAWMLLTGEDGGFVSLAGAGHQEAFVTLADYVRQGSYPPCVGDVVGRQEPFVAYESPEQHAACPLAGVCRGSVSFVARLEHGGKVYGVLGGSVAAEMAHDEEETGLFREVAGDISYALHDLELEEQRKRAEEALRESKELYRGVVDLTDAAIVRYDLEGCRTFVNEAFTNRYGKPAEELLAGTVGDQRVPEDREEAWRLFRQCVESGKPARGIIGRHEMDGRSFYTRSNYTLIFGPDGRVSGVQVTSVDITELVEAQERLRLRSQELEALFNIASILVQPGSFEERRARVVEAVASVAQADRVALRLLHGKEQELRLVAEAGEGKGALPPIVPLPAYRDTIAGLALARGEPLVVNDYGSHSPAYSSEVPLGVRSVVQLPIKVGDRVLGVLGVHSLEPGHFTPQRVRLLTAVADGIGVLLEQARLYEEAGSARALVKLNEMKSRLLSTVSHELRTPLGAIKGYATMMLDYGERVSRSERGDYLVSIDQSCDRLTELIEHLLDTSRVETGTLRVEKGACDLRQVVNEVAARVSQGLVDHRLIVSIPERLPPVEADERRIEQVLDNLLSNAVKYSPQGGEIRLLGELRDPVVVVSVSDQGIGIEEEDLERVFAPFFRVEAGRASEMPGAGLGLAVCKGLVEAHGGRIWAESKPGKGSTFYFTLPLPQEEERVGQKTEGAGHRRQ